MIRPRLGTHPHLADVALTCPLCRTRTEAWQFSNGVHIPACGCSAFIVGQDDPLPLPEEVWATLPPEARWLYDRATRTPVFHIAP